MPTPSQRYASLANDSYVDRNVGIRKPHERELVNIGGELFRIAAHVDNKKTGYQGTVYIRETSGEVIVAHRGTEFDRELYRDGVRADGAMVVNRTNPQARDAIELTRIALSIDKGHRKDFPDLPPVTLTGHSLGGALAQISAHHFGLKGETFNAYGAHSLGYRIPEGGDAMLNHVMATDFVSAASGHYGQVRIYATAGDISRLQQGGFSNSRGNFLIPDAPLVVAGRSIDAHKMHNFLPVDAAGKRDVSVLSDPQAHRRALDNQRMIGEYRDDIRGIRSGVTILSRSAPELFMDAIDGIRGPLPAGAPARRQHEQTSLQRIDSLDSPAFPLFQGAEKGVLAMDASVGREPDQRSRQLAGALAAEMYVAGGSRIDAVMMSSDASRAFAVQGRVEDPAHLRASVAVVPAMDTPLEQSSVRVVEVAHARQAEQPVRETDRQHQLSGAGMA